MTCHRIVQDHKIAWQNNTVCHMGIEYFGKAAVEQGQHCAAANSHDKQRGTDLCKLSQSIDGKGPDRGPHE